MLVKASFALSILSCITAFSLGLLTLSIALYERNTGLLYIFGLPALIMFFVTSINAINSGIKVSYHLHIKSFPVSISDSLIKMKGVQKKPACRIDYQQWTTKYTYAPPRQEANPQVFWQIYVRKEAQFIMTNQNVFLAFSTQHSTTLCNF